MSALLVRNQSLRFKDTFSDKILKNPEYRADFQLHHIRPLVCILCPLHKHWQYIAHLKNSYFKLDIIFLLLE